jgi:RNA methyltransferase, TrmH family
MPTAEISSIRNPLLRAVKKALQKGTLTDEGWCVAESPHLVEEARRSGRRIAALLCLEAMADEAERLAPEAHLHCLPRALFHELSATESSQGMIALVEAPTWREEELLRGTPLLLLLDGVQDPGNVGGMLRTAEAFGASGVICLKGTASIWNAKALRGSAGSVFRLPVLSGREAEDIVAWLQLNGIPLFAAEPRAQRSLIEADLRQPCALAVGSEGNGLSALLQARAEGLRIPTQSVESLNAAMAAGILLYEAARQRSQ